MNAYGRVLSWGARAWRTPASRSRRQVVNREEYKPSRRSSAPTPPEPLAWPASARMRRLYSAVKRRRLACATTSGSGRWFGAAPALPSVALRSHRRQSRWGWSGTHMIVHVVHEENLSPPCTVIKERRVSHLCWHGGTESDYTPQVGMASPNFR